MRGREREGGEERERERERWEGGEVKRGGVKGEREDPSSH